MPSELSKCPFCNLHPTDNDRGSFKKSSFGPMYELRHWCGDKARQITIALPTEERVIAAWNQRATQLPVPVEPSEVLVSREEAAKMADLWANSHSCDVHDDDPCSYR